MAKDWGQPIPAAPFVAWLTSELERIGSNDTLRLDELTNEVPAKQILADRLGINERTLRRYKNSLDAEGKRTDVFARNRIEDMLERADVLFADVYPEIAAAEDIALEQEAFCGSCHEIVTPIRGACPWCERPVDGEIPRRMYCKREDAMRFPAVNGACWRCGGTLVRHVPLKACACGCGTMIPSFDAKTGVRRARALGHTSSWEPKGEVPVEPFAEWLEEQLRTLDPIQALARRVNLSRDFVLEVLGRRVETVPTERVTRALRIARLEGQGTSNGSRPGSKKIGDLYPDRGGVLRCPHCHGRKQAKSEMCRACRLERGWPCGSAATSLTPELLQEARRLRCEEGWYWKQIAAHLQPQTKCKSVDSLRTGLISEFSRRGWSRERGGKQQGLAA